MPELRKNILTGNQVVIAVERSKRPSDLKSDNDEFENLSEYDEKCPLCLGNEEMTPPEQFRIQSDDKWVVRAIPNKFPILSKTSEVLENNEDIFIKKNGVGIHEVLIESNKHNKSFFNMKSNDFNNILRMYKNRFEKLLKFEFTSYVSLFKNNLKKAGASLVHSHAQIITVPIVPENIEIELRNAKEFYNSNKKNIFEFIIESELNRDERVIYNSENFSIIAPFASAYNYEVEIIFKNLSRFEKIKDTEINELSILMERLFQKYKQVLGVIPFNMIVHSLPKGRYDMDDKYNVHIHIVPRLSNQAGFELGTGIMVNAVPPENAAQYLKFDVKSEKQK
ncbi:hypothetical protein TR13x_05770 [Caloranaerobacter sp. TR13]|uniref:galactose-1-phosphate uridylyltransferase n=1 Tax=Caloranaerobacter sp. TR13 TaxID=1302151 RepID=UPI0006D47C59|nr:galactose-1-phosphate uridylyltransferase [Caloranaerobacter sp. TR13]KPU27260.1 hypothetical protein TR13x_05770 [Caloranaerobacter sp. TR13]